MEKFKDKKIIGLFILLIIIVTLSIVTYTKNKKNIFKDEYKDNIFIDKNNSEKMQEDSSLENTDKNKKDNKKNTIIVEIKGEVIRPDVYEVTEGSIVKDLINTAGGLTENAYIDNINRAEELHNHQLVTIVNKNEINSLNSTNEQMTGNNTSDNTLININTATKEELQHIPGIGPSKAESIITYREENGDFKNTEEIMNVSGIGEKSFEKIKDKITL